MIEQLILMIRSGGVPQIALLIVILVLLAFGAWPAGSVAWRALSTAGPNIRTGKGGPGEAGNDARGLFHDL